MRSAIGWDIGGVNTKVTRVSRGRVVAVSSRPYELQRDPAALAPLLRALAAEVGAGEGDVHAVTMTAELSQMFRTKREGVGFVLDAMEAAFASSAISVYAVDGRFLSTSDARQEPLAVAAANWAATARIVAASAADALLIDIGTTSTDVIPIVGGVVAACGWTDPDRLASGELVYTGAVRTPVEAMASHVPFGEGDAGLSAENFALAGDVHVWRGDLEPIHYTSPTPDGRPATREFAGERLARAICADRDMVDEAGVTAIADALAASQVARIVAAIAKVRARHPSLHTAVVTGLGTFIADRAARESGMRVVELASVLGESAARCAPAASVALLRQDPGGVEVVAKVGGGLLARPDCLDKVLSVLADAAAHHPLLIVPGGGPFADAVREQDARIGLPDDAAHWMAILAMDQYAHLIAARLPGATLVWDADGIAQALRSRAIPVLMPSTWLRRADPLPHSWEVTSDSIAAWIARKVGAARLLLVKPPGAAGADVVDPYFARVCEGLQTDVIAADEIGSLRLATRPSGP
jgi:probable H4MPT-linked C1 transfer pathway protein